MDGMNELDDLRAQLKRINDEPTAISVLEQFNDTFVNQAFADRVLGSKEAKKSGSIAPRASGFDDMSDRAQREVCTVLACIAKKVAQTLLPQDGQEGRGHLPQGSFDRQLAFATEIRIVTDLVFHEGNVRGVSKGWYASTMLAVEAPACKHATEKYVAASTGSRLEIKIASGTKKKPGLGTYIKLFNANEKLRMAFDIVI